MAEKEIMEGNIKLNIFDSFPYKDLKKVIEKQLKSKQGVKDGNG